jgi:putative endonuclease
MVPPGARRDLLAMNEQPPTGSPTGTSLELGREGERLAADLLERRGWTILERNYRAGRKEVDLIARRGALVAFVEVKSRSGTGFGHPLEAITWKKRREISAVARQWWAAHPGVGRIYRFDAVAVFFGPEGPTRIEHVEDAWRRQR